MNRWFLLRFNHLPSLVLTPCTGEACGSKNHFGQITPTPLHLSRRLGMEASDRQPPPPTCWVRAPHQAPAAKGATHSLLGYAHRAMSRPTHKTSVSRSLLGYAHRATAHKSWPTMPPRKPMSSARAARGQGPTIRPPRSSGVTHPPPPRRQCQQTTRSATANTHPNPPDERNGQESTERRLQESEERRLR